MIDVIERSRDQINSICKKHAVKRLELFGSTARGDFDPLSSDVEFFVEFLDYNSPAIPDQWFGLQEDLADLLHRAVDLTSLRTATNPFFLQMANRHKVTLYAA